MTTMSGEVLRPPAGSAPSAPLRSEWPHYLLQGVALAAGYLLLDTASFLFWIDPVPVKPWNPQAGLAVALLCAAGLRHAPAVFAGALSAEVWLRNPHDPWLVEFAEAAVLTLALCAIAGALRWRGFPRAHGSVRAMRDFLAITAVGAALSAFAYVGTAALTQDVAAGAFLASFSYKWLGDAVGILGVTPVVLLLVAPRKARAASRRPAALWLDAVAFIGSIAIVVAFVFGTGPLRGERLFYLLFLPLIVIAMRHRLPGAAVGVTVMQVAIVVALRLADRTPDDAAGYLLLMLALGATTLLLGAMGEERRRSQLALERRGAELRAQQQALADAMQVAAASETASTLAHEMSQPLSAIGTYARAGVELIRRGNGTREDLARVLERIVDETARTRDTVQRIRDFFRSGSLRRERVEVAQLATDAQDALRDRLQAAGITLRVDLPSTLPAVDVDRVQIGTVLHNLIGNAVDALSSAASTRWIRLAAREHGAFVELDVADSGPGIDPAIAGELFAPLATTKPTGMGLGLPIARTLAQAHGGRLELAASRPTTFRLALPIHGHDDT